MRIQGCMTLLGLAIGVGFGAVLGGVLYALTREMVFFWMPAIGAGLGAIMGASLDVGDRWASRHR